jgi:N-methylhydantoinase A/oxoprolinase/acetone carboxylase beta subunit
LGDSKLRYELQGYDTPHTKDTVFGMLRSPVTLFMYFSSEEGQVNLMILGIDVGGTNTDAVIVKDGEILRTLKVPTEPEHLLSCVSKSLHGILGADIPISAVSRVVLSTTLSTNAIVQGKLDKAGMIVTAGPGLDPRHYSTGEHYYIVPGAIDHRGREIEPLDRLRVREIVDILRQSGISTIAAVSKFSTRNPLHENQVLERASGYFPYNTAGHALSGSLNFPRRIATAFLNASVSRLHYDFVEAVIAAMKEKGLKAPLFILKADGGTMDVRESQKLPVYTICSGPAASVMGIMALAEAGKNRHYMGDRTFVGLDIGGTTTDISVFWKGVPLFVPKGIRIGPHQTLVRGLLTRSIPIGGDSEISIRDGDFAIGPLRKGSALAFGGPVVTLTDALNIAGAPPVPGDPERRPLPDVHFPFPGGDTARSREGIEELARIMGMNAQECADQVVRKACRKILDSVSHLLDEINSRPVYTIHDMIHGEMICGGTTIVVGGPARALRTWLQELNSAMIITPDHYDVANALGAALSRVTAAVTLVADTEEGTLFAAEENHREPVDRSFTVEKARSRAIELLDGRMERMGERPGSFTSRVVEEQEFAMVRGFYRTGTTIRVRAEVTPGLVGTLKGGS